MYFSEVYLFPFPPWTLTLELSLGLCCSAESPGCVWQMACLTQPAVSPLGMFQGCSAAAWGGEKQFFVFCLQLTWGWSMDSNFTIHSNVPHLRVSRETGASRQVQLLTSEIWGSSESSASWHLANSLYHRLEDPMPVFTNSIWEVFGYIKAYKLFCGL